MPLPSVPGLLKPDITDATRWGPISNTWVTSLAPRKAFRVRGHTWFKEQVGRSINSLQNSKAALDQELGKRNEWLGHALPWTDPFAPAQMYAVQNKEPMRLDKAVKAIMLLELAAREKKDENGTEIIDQNKFYSNMWIEPAVFCLLDFDKNYLAKQPGNGDALLADLGARLSQKQAVFRAMAAGESVSYRLAFHIKRIIETELRLPSVGQIAITQSLRSRSNTEEIIDGDSEPA